MADTQPQEHRVDPAGVPGWGVDSDPRNDPTYPYRLRTEEGGRTMDWTRPPLQPRSVEILRSIEHNRLPAVTGTSSPPRGLSGVLRRAAFAYSESDWRHWLILLGADRLNMAEGVVDDLSRGSIPNVPREMGLRADWQFNRTNLLRKVAVAASISAAAWLLCKRRDGTRQAGRARRSAGAHR
ncbi:hypothetical protein [Halodurantibacterium flavum]|uniref:Uncharacterized protein n=1 Tax=Halodurantibacterium flavum TaxID=1382802 RepID=A0ABW4RZ59_9RHOB